MQRLFPPSSAFNRFTAWSVVPEPAKKSKINAFFLLFTKNRNTSCTAYTDLGNENLLPIIPVNNLLPNSVAS